MFTFMKYGIQRSNILWNVKISKMKNRSRPNRYEEGWLMEWVWGGVSINSKGSKRGGKSEQRKGAKNRKLENKMAKINQNNFRYYSKWEWTELCG